MLKKVTVFAFALIIPSLALADYNWYTKRNYEVSVTNITKGQTFTPIISATHLSSIQFFELGAPAIAPIAELAESGNIAPLKAVLDESRLVTATANTEGLLAPGATVTWKLPALTKDKFSFAAMLIPTNDTFVSLNTVRLPYHGSVTYYAKAYDAGSEFNDELCENIPGPRCKGAGVSAEDGEGFVHIATGISGEGPDLKASVYDWRDAVAKVTITRVR